MAKQRALERTLLPLEMSDEQIREVFKREDSNDLRNGMAQLVRFRDRPVMRQLVWAVLEIYSPHLSLSKTPTKGIRLLGLIKRVEAQEQTLAIAFVEENDR